MEEFVNVSVRIRPSFNEGAQNSCLQIINKHPAVLLVLDKSQTYHFDNVFDDDINQEDIYNETVKRLVEKVKLGYNCTVFAYGQTGTGKSYTIGTNPHINQDNEAGLISRTLEDFFSQNDNSDVEIEISFIEIYNEKVFDLLGSENNKFLLVKGFTVQGFQKVKVYNSYDALGWLKIGSSRRHTGETKQNSNSSRSHAIFSIYCHTRYKDKETVGKLNLVDLAGSESVKKTGNRGSSFYEGININKGLLSLGQVMTALSTNSSHIPYRQSIITTILQDSLNKKNFISLIACVSSNLEDLGETLQTLEFSSRVKKMKNKPELNEFIVQYKKDNPLLFMNNVIRGQTPVKRSNGFIYETPFKKPRNVLPVIKEPITSHNTLNFDVSPIFSSSITSAVSETSNLSPVIKKYMTAMEASLMTKLEDVIRSSLRRQTRASFKRINKENLSPIITKSRLLNTLTFEKTELMNSTTNSLDETGTSLSKMTVLCVNNSNIPQTSLTNNSLESPAIQTDINDKFVFKKPVNAVVKRKVQKKAQISELNSDIKNSETSTRRRSVRLELKQNNSINFGENIDETLNKSTRRRSVRLQAKRQSMVEKENISSLKLKKRETKIFSPCEKCTHTKRSNGKLKESPISARNKQVLTILNKGSLKELEKLHTVGTKTAEKILLFRQIKGKFKSLADMAEMPYWTNKKYDKFLIENFLKSDG